MREMLPIPRVPGIVDPLERDNTSFTQRQTPEYPDRVPECNSASISDAEGPLSVIRQDEPLTSTQIHQFNKCPISLPPFDMIIFMDASKQGWGAQCNGILTGERWNSNES